MPRSLTLLFRRDSTKDQPEGKIPVEGYQVFWPDGRAVVLGLNTSATTGNACSGWAGTCEAARNC